MVIKEHFHPQHCYHGTDGKVDYNAIVCLFILKQASNTTICIWECIPHNLINIQ